MKRLLLLFAGLLALTACTTLHQGVRESAAPDTVWTVLPFINNTETPFAAERAEAISTALLYARGIRQVAVMPVEPSAEAEPPVDRGLKRRQDGLVWAKKQQIRYALQGTVTEWRYKVGLDGEPVAGFTLQLLDLQNDKVVWTGSSGKSGWSREAVSAVAQQVLQQLIATIELR